MEWLNLVHGAAPHKPPAAFGPGDEIRVWYRIVEQGKERLGQFEGLVIRYRGSGRAKTFTVRRVTHGEGVERVFPVDSKIISRIEVLRPGKVKRSRLYFLRTVVGKRRIASGEGKSGSGASAGAPGEAAKTAPPGTTTGHATQDAESATDKPEGTQPPAGRSADRAASRA